MVRTTQILDVGLAAIQLAYFVVMKFYNMPHEQVMLEYKDADGKTPVGKADRAAGKAMIDYFLRKLPGIIVVDEDLGQFGTGIGPWAGWVVYLDGVDGTSHFIRRYGMLLPAIGQTFTFNDELVFSITADLMQRNVMVAEKGAGAWLMPIEGGTATKLQVSRGRPLAERMFAEDGLSYEITDIAFGKFVTRMNKFAMNRRTWASCLVHAKYVAQDLVDAALMHAVGGKWDLGACLGVTEAGGVATDVMTGLGIKHLDREFQLVLVSTGLDDSLMSHHELSEWARECYGADYPGFRGKR